MGKRFSELFKTKQLANRIIIYETLRLHKAPSRVLTNSVALLASAIDSLERIDCDLLKKYMEDFLVTECEFQYGTPSCIFNCLNYFSCMQKRQFCKKCTKSNAPTIEDCIECFLHQADENTWGIMRDAHLHCENYELDEENLI
ncbi:MAG: hypothetical protein HPY60_11570 [Candidatus Methanofastidiosum sp.]|nr:hypothetical protein [Methanofastidiosum sp.]